MLQHVRLMVSTDCRNKFLQHIATHWDFKEARLKTVGEMELEFKCKKIAETLNASDFNANNSQHQNRYTGLRQSDDRYSWAACETVIY